MTPPPRSQSDSPNDPARPRVAFLQDGGRLRYALPVALKQAGLLEFMAADWFVASPWSMSGLLTRMIGVAKPALGRQLASRSHPQLTASDVRTAPGILWRTHRARSRFASVVEFYEWEAKLKADWLMRRELEDANVLMGFVRNIHPTLLRYAQQRGLRTVADQIIAPVRVEAAEARVQSERWPGWGPPEASSDEDRVAPIEEQTWAACDDVTCASDYVKQGLIWQGVASDKITVIPYPVDVADLPFTDRRNRTGRTGPLTIGFVGRVSLRKGAPYFLQVAKRLASPSLKFVMLGPVGIDPAVARQYESCVQFAGKVPIGQVPDHLAKFDLIYFPTTCEGSAGALMEAMASGLPVVTSPNSGTAARHGVEGLLCAYDDLDAAAAHIERLAGDANLRYEMGVAARRRAEQLDITCYGRRLAELLNRRPATASH